MKIKLFLETACILCMVIALCAIAVTMLAPNNYPVETLEESTYVVKYGDCLWNIADVYCPDDMEMWDYIDLIKVKNNLSNSSIHTGQRLTVYSAQ